MSVVNAFQLAGARSKFLDAPQAIRAASSPEEAAALGRRAQREQPHLLPPDWGTAKLAVMLAAVRAKFAQHMGPRAMLLTTASGKLGPLEVSLLRYNTTALLSVPSCTYTALEYVRPNLVW